MRKRVLIEILVAVALGFVAAWLVVKYGPRQVSREQFLIEVRQRELKTVTIYPRNRTAVAGYGNPGAIRTVLAKDDQAFPAELRTLGVEVIYDTSDSVDP